MISICIPLYNYTVVNLVKDLASQAELLAAPSEILIIDDASEISFKTENKSIATIPGVKYVELEHNIGRSKIRNLFLQYASFNNLLFIDCDAALNSPDFLKKYIDTIDGKSVITGGVTYSKAFPRQEYSLRWTYGHKRESTNANERGKEPYKSFKTFNFALPRQLFEKICFDETVVGYGHEDTLFGIALKKAKVDIVHIENPLIHLGLETNDIFLTKTRQGIENLLKLYSSTNKDPEIVQNIKLLNSYVNLNQVLRYFLAITYKLAHPVLRFLLTKKHPNLLLFDFYKLGYLCSLSKINY